MVLKRNSKFLDLSFASDLSDKVLDFLQKGTNLVSLNLQGCTSLTDQLLQKIVSSHPSLKQLFLAYCEKLTDQSLISLSNISLNSLDISRCPNLTDKGILNFLSHSKNLQYLDLFDSPISSGCIESIQKQYPNIFLIA